MPAAPEQTAFAQPACDPIAFICLCGLPCGPARLVRNRAKFSGKVGPQQVLRQLDALGALASQIPDLVVAFLGAGTAQPWMVTFARLLAVSLWHVLCPAPSLSFAGLLQTLQSELFVVQPFAP